MKTIVKTTRFPDGGDPEDTNHCALYALSALTGWSYKTCAGLASVFAGRKPGKGVDVFKLFGVGIRQFHEFEFLYVAPYTRRHLFGGRQPTVAQFAKWKAGASHDYFVVTNAGRGAHAIAVKRGVVFNNWPTRHVRHRVLYYWLVTRKTVDTGLPKAAH